MERDAKHVAGVAAHKAEKAWVQKLKEFSKQGLTVFPGSELLLPICDPEAEWKATNVTWLADEAIRVAKKSGVEAVEEEAEEEKGEGVTFITDIEGDRTLQQDFTSQQDFVPFGEDNYGQRGFSEDDSDEDIQGQLGRY